MARKHVISYFLQVQQQYFEMLENVSLLDKAAKEGKVTEEQFLQAQESLTILKNNYERIAWIIMLLNKPNRNSKQESLYDKQWYEELKGASKEAILDENKDALADFKKLLAEVNKNGN